MFKVINKILILILTIVLLVLICLPFFNFRYMVVLSGSMKPALKPGDVILIGKTLNIRTKDIITYYSGTSLVTHRVSEIKNIDGKKIFITKGDYNSVADNITVEEKQIVGKVIVKFPRTGYLLKALKSPLGFFSLLCTCIILILYEGKKLLKKVN